MAVIQGLRSIGQIFKREGLGVDVCGLFIFIFERRLEEGLIREPRRVGFALSVSVGWESQTLIFKSPSSEFGWFGS